MSMLKLKHGVVSEDGMKFEVLLPELGLHCIFSPGLGDIWLVSSLFTLTAFVSTRTPNYFINAVEDYDHNLFVVQKIIKIKPQYYFDVEPFRVLPLVKCTSKLESFFRSTAIINLEIVNLDSNVVLVEYSTKLINLDMKTRRATIFHPQMIKKFEKKYDKPYESFPDVSYYLKMDQDSSESYLESLMKDKYLEIFKMEHVLFESDEDWNEHVSNSVYLRSCANCLSRAISLNETFKDTYGRFGTRLRISQMSNSFFKECKAQDTLTILCIHNKNSPTVLDFKLFKKDLTGKHQIVYISQLVMIENSSKL